MLCISIVMVIPFILQSCEKKVLQLPEETTDYSGTILENERLTARGKLISGVKWTPLGLIPSAWASGFYNAGEEYTGIPYSSVKELDKFIGIHVSFYTFLSAIRNPNSVLYTEDASKPPYHGINCSTFYGTVCSATVNYALGLSCPFSTRLYPSFPEQFQKVENQDISEIKPGCIMLKRGSHVVVVTKVWIDTGGRVEYVQILESDRRITSFRTYTAEEFLQRWSINSWVMYQYMKMDEIPNVEENPDDFIFNVDFCTTRGDNVCYRAGESVAFSIFNSNYFVLELYKDGVFFDSKNVVNRESLTYDNLPFGDYAAYLVNGKEKSRAIHFEIIEANVSLTENGKNLIINYSSTNGVPRYISFSDCNTFTPNQFFPLTSEDKVAGSVIVNMPKDKTQVCKVFFAGRYGVISNEYKSIQLFLEQ